MFRSASAKNTLAELDPSLSMFYLSALDNGSYSNKIRLASVVILWMIGLIGPVLVMSLLSGGGVRGLSLLRFVAIIIRLLLQAWRWRSNWRMQKNYLPAK